MTFKKWQKPPKKWEKIKEVEIKEVEKAVETVVENEINEIENEIGASVQPEEEIIVKKEPKVKWTIWWTNVVQPKGRIRFEAQQSAFPLFMLPADIRSYLVAHWLTSDVYKKDKEWLEKHNVDMKIVQKLKEFLTEKL